MNLTDFNTLDDAAAVAALTACADVPAWAEAVAAGRPYPDVESLRAAADTRAADWSDAEVEQALADHPRIGERHAGGGASAAMSRGEQAGVDPRDQDTAARLADGNRRYEQRFGRIYLVRAAGRSAEEMLDLLEQRLDHDPATELRVTAGQLREIAALRLAALVDDGLAG